MAHNQGNILLWILIAGLADTFGCAPFVHYKQPRTEVVAYSRQFAEVRDGQIVLPRSMLGRTLSLTVTAIRMPELADIVPMRTRLVHLELEKDHLFMKEITGGRSESSPGDRVIAKFAAKIMAGTVSFDFNEGMNKLYFESNIYELPSGKTSVEVAVDLVDTTITFVGVRRGILVIDRNVTVVAPGKKQAAGGWLKYGLSVYTGNKEFLPIPNNSVRGFYVNAPVHPQVSVNPGSKQNEVGRYAHRHDITKPVIFYLMPETPAIRRRDIENALSYWNDAFEAVHLGRPLKTGELEKGGDPLDPGRSAILWSKGQSASTSCGINTTDPLTGQITQSLVIIGSAFEAAGRGIAVNQWIRMRIDAGLSPDQPPAEVVERIVSDYMTFTFIHEIGHCLGFRHNFAASLAGDLDPEDARQSFVKYIRDDKVVRETITSSALEYLAIPLQLIVSGQIRKGRGPLPHDVNLIESYNGGSPKFRLAGEAEDNHFVDCAEFDEGKDSSLGCYWIWEDNIDETAFELAQSIRAGAPDFDPPTRAKIIAEVLTQIARHFSADADYLALRSQYPAELSAAQKAEYRETVLAGQRRSYRGLTGPRAEFIRDLVGNKFDAQRSKALAGVVRKRTEYYLAALGSPLPESLKGYFVQLADALDVELAPLKAVTYASVSCL